MRKTLAAFLVVAFVAGSSATSASAGSADVHIVNNAPNPAEITIQEGDTIVFVNDDDIAHAIWASGEQRGRTIAPHSRSEAFGPFVTGGQGGRSDYQIDQGGAPGVILVAGPTTTTTEPTTTTAAPTTIAPTTSTTTTSTTSTTSTTTTSTTTTTTTVVRSSSSSSSGGGGQGTTSSMWLAVFGGLLVLAGIANVVRVMTRPKYRRRRQA